MQTTAPVKDSEVSRVTFRVPDFIDGDGIEYTDIEVIVESDTACDMLDTLHKVGSRK
jgi:hypothetical protein